VSLKAVPLPAGGCLPPLRLTKRGTVSSVFVDAAVWGRIDTPVAQRMAAAAVQALKKACTSRQEAIVKQDTSGQCDVCGATVAAITDCQQWRLMLFML
jgi:RNA 3'-terminal phosphate cyclase